MPSARAMALLPHLLLQLPGAAAATRASPDGPRELLACLRPCTLRALDPRPGTVNWRGFDRPRASLAQDVGAQDHWLTLVGADLPRRIARLECSNVFLAVAGVAPRLCAAARL